MAAKKSSAKPNILLIAIDSLLSTHMSCYGYQHLTTPHIDKFAEESVLFENTFSPNVPTTPAYTCMLTGQDVFSTQVVALRHEGKLRAKVTTMPEILRGEGYNTTCIGFTGNPASRGFSKYIDYRSWGDLSDGSLPKAHALNEVAVPEIDRLNKSKKPFFLMLRHMDPHSPYMPPPPYDRMFYHGNECDPYNKSMQPVMDFAPFSDYFKTWLPVGITDKNFVEAQYDGAVAYLDACLQRIFHQLKTLGILDNTIVVVNADHGETLYEHECWFDHHGMYDCNLQVPLIIRYPKKMPAGKRVAGYNRNQDLTPTLLDLAGVRTKIKFDGHSLMPLIKGNMHSFDSSFYITECTWMRKHGWRTPEWKLIVALEPDFHFMPEVELYNLIQDPDELKNVAAKHPGITKLLQEEMQTHIAKRQRETGLDNPMYHQNNWHGHNDKGITAFESSEQAYKVLHIGDAKSAQKLQAKLAKNTK